MTTKLFVSLGVVLLGITTLPQSALSNQTPIAPSQSPWKLKELIRTFWCEPPAEDARLAALSRENFSLTWCPGEALDTVARHGLRGMIHNEDLLKPWCLDDPVKRKKLDALIQRVRHHPAMEAYWLADEPWHNEFKEWARLTKYIKERDPAHFSYVNALPIIAFPGGGYRAYLRQFIRIIQPRILSFDHYPFYKNNDSLQYFENLELVREETRAANIPFLSIIQSCSFEGKWRLPTNEQMRWSVYTNLAYGAKGISYFTYWGPKRFGGLYQDGKRMPLVDTVTKLNAEIDALSPVLLPSNSTAVYHTKPMPMGTHPIPDSSPIKIVDRGHGQFLLGFFEAADGKKFVMVVNRDFQKSRTAVLEMRNVALQNEYDRNARKFINPPGRDWFGRFPIQLAPGDGRLFQYG